MLCPQRQHCLSPEQSGACKHTAASTGPAALKHWGDQAEQAHNKCQGLWTGHPESRCRLSYLADAIDGTQQELVQVSVVQQDCVLENDCLHHVVHLQAQPAAGMTHGNRQAMERTPAATKGYLLWQQWLRSSRVQHPDLCCESCQLSAGNQATTETGRFTPQL